jgi:ABC-type taurine transport system ATPase subunit
MLETKVIGNREWARGFLSDADIRFLEDIDYEIRVRCLQEKQRRNKAKTYEQLVEQDGDKMPTHCEHGIPLNQKCGVCRALLG